MQTQAKRFLPRSSSIWTRAVPVLLLLLLCSVSGYAQDAQPPMGPGGPVSGMGPGMNGGIGAWLPGARGVLGTVTASTPSSLILRLDSGEIYTVNFSANTRVLQQPARPERRNGQAATRPRMEPIAASSIHVGDAITAVGDVDDAAKAVGAVAIIRLDPARAAELKTMEANYGKTWLAGDITAIHGTQITILGAVDRKPHVVTVDDGTSFRRMRESITLMDLQTGATIRAAGSGTANQFLATEIRVMPSRRRQPAAPTAAGAAR